MVRLYGVGCSFKKNALDDTLSFKSMIESYSQALIDVKVAQVIAAVYCNEFRWIKSKKDIHNILT